MLVVPVKGKEAKKSVCERGEEEQRGEGGEGREGEGGEGEGGGGEGGGGGGRSVRRRGKIRWRASVGGGTLEGEGGVEGAFEEQVIKPQIDQFWGDCFASSHTKAKIGQFWEIILLLLIHMQIIPFDRNKSGKCQS